VSDLDHGSTLRGLAGRTLLRQHRMALVLLVMAALIQIGGIIAIWVSWRWGLTLVLMFGSGACVGLTAEHTAAIKRLEASQLKRP
jgi:hypothetical protein